jgi:outer membrane protein TolC
MMLHIDEPRLVRAFRARAAHRPSRLHALVRRGLEPLELSCLLVMFASAVPSVTWASDARLTLARALELGRQRAFPVKSARQQEVSSEAAVDGQRAAYLPTLSAALAGNGKTARETQVKAPPEHGLFAFVSSSAGATGSAALQWTLYDFGRTAGGVSAARERQRAAVQDVASAELRVLSDVASAYVNLYYRQQLRDVSQATLAQREERVVIARGLIKSGLLPPLEELRTSARAASARLALVTAEADVLDARAALASLLLLDPSQDIQIAAPRLREPNQDVARATRAADSTPSVRGALAAVRAKLAAVDAARAGYLPTLALSVTGSYSFSQYNKETDVTNVRSAAGSLLLSVPLLDLSIPAQVRGASADAASAEADAQELRRLARDEAARAALATEATQHALEQARATLNETAKVLTIVEARYREGLSSPLELIDAETADFDARVSVTQSELAHALATIRACVATGQNIVEAP